MSAPCVAALRPGEPAGDKVAFTTFILDEMLTITGGKMKYGNKKAKPSLNCKSSSFPINASKPSGTAECPSAETAFSRSATGLPGVLARLWSE